MELLILVHLAASYGATKIFTDEKGYACSIAIPYGTYIVRETIKETE